MLSRGIVRLKTVAELYSIAPSYLISMVRDFQLQPNRRKYPAQYAERYPLSVFFKPDGSSTGTKGLGWVAHQADIDNHLDDLGSVRHARTKHRPVTRRTYPAVYAPLP